MTLASVWPDWAVLYHFGDFKTPCQLFFCVKVAQNCANILDYFWNGIIIFTTYWSHWQASSCTIRKETIGGWSSKARFKMKTSPLQDEKQGHTHGTCIGTYRFNSQVVLSSWLVQWHYIGTMYLCHAKMELYLSSTYLACFIIYNALSLLCENWQVGAPHWAIVDIKSFFEGFFRNECNVVVFCSSSGSKKSFRLFCVSHCQKCKNFVYGKICQKLKK